MQDFSLINEVNFTELMISRLCHDIAGPIGAINNASEFLQDEKMRARAISLTCASSRQAFNRLQFFRYAYGGYVSSSDVSIEMLEDISKYLFEDSKSKVEWIASDKSVDPYIDHKIGKMTINMVLIANASLIYGGDVSVSISLENNIVTVKILASGSHVKLDLQYGVIWQLNPGQIEP